MAAGVACDRPLDRWYRPYNPDSITLPLSQYPMAWASQPSSIDAVSQSVSTFRASKKPWGYGFMMMFALHIVVRMHPLCVPVLTT
jgi:hypothetical protein